MCCIAYAYIASTVNYGSVRSVQFPNFLGLSLAQIILKHHRLVHFTCVSHLLTPLVLLSRGTKIGI